jgi:hypothetical protein
LGSTDAFSRSGSIQDYLEKQAWYKPNKNYSNAALKPIEKANLDLIRITEAEKHSYIEPGTCESGGQS